MKEFNFAATLTRLLKERKVKGREVADAIGVKRQSISDYCLGRTAPKYPVLVKLADYLGVTCDFLLTGVEPEDKKEHQDLGLSGEAIRLLKKYQDEGAFSFINELLSDPEFYSLLLDALKFKVREKSIFEHFANKENGKTVHEMISYFCDKNRVKANSAVLSYLNVQFFNKTGFGLTPVPEGFEFKNLFLDEGDEQIYGLHPEQSASRSADEAKA